MIKGAEELMDTRLKGVEDEKVHNIETTAQNVTKING